MQQPSNERLLNLLELAYRILNRDGIRPLMGKAFTQTELERLEIGLIEGGRNPQVNT